MELRESGTEEIVAAEMILLRKLAGLLLALFGVLVLCGSVLSFADPKEAKLADDTDPFGTPPSRLSSLCVGVVSMAVVISGLRMMRAPRS